STGPDAGGNVTPWSPFTQVALAVPGEAGDNGSMDSGLPARGDDAPELTAPWQLGRERDLGVLGSTGSLGTQAADVVRRTPDRFRITALAAGGGNPALLASQAIEFRVEVVAVASEEAVSDVHDALQAQANRTGRPVPKVLAGPASVAEV